MEIKIGGTYTLCKLEDMKHPNTLAFPFNKESMYFDGETKIELAYTSTDIVGAFCGHIVGRISPLTRVHKEDLLEYRKAVNPPKKDKKHSPTIRFIRGSA